MKFYTSINNIEHINNTIISFNARMQSHLSVDTKGVMQILGHDIFDSNYCMHCKIGLISKM